jgi:dihydroorotate dehydrogenase (NAD+) catalytic subunit
MIKQGKNDILAVDLGRLRLINPVMNASGTYDFTPKTEKIISQLGAFVTKTVTLKPRSGNPPPRLVEQEAGLLNAIGLQNKGVESFIEEKLPQLKKVKKAETKIIVSVAGESLEEYLELVSRLDRVSGIDGIEINISCPNVENGYVWAKSPAKTYSLISQIRSRTSFFLITKLPPVFFSLRELARKAELAGTEAISLINTVKGLAVDLTTSTPLLKAGGGGLSGPAIKPIALRMVWEVAQMVKVPVIGIGGIATFEDALEFMMVGASAVGVGTANFVSPTTMPEIIKGMKKYLKKNKISNIKEIIGSLKV